MITFNISKQFMYCIRINNSLLGYIEKNLTITIQPIFTSFVIQNLTIDGNCKAQKIYVTSMYEHTIPPLMINGALMQGFSCEIMDQNWTALKIFLFTLCLVVAFMGTVEGLLDFDAFRIKLYLTTRLMAHCDYSVLKTLKVFKTLNSL